MTRVTLYTAGHLHTAVPHCSHSRAPIVHTAVPRENNEHGCVYLRCRAVCKLPGCVEGHPWMSLTHWGRDKMAAIFKCIFFNENVWISIKVSLTFVPKAPINNIPTLVQIMAWRRPGNKPLSEPMMVSLLTHICITQPQWSSILVQI